MRLLFRVLCIALLASSAHGQETHLYAVDIGPNRQPPWQVIRYDESGQNPELFTNAQLSRPQDIVYLEHEGTTIVSNLASNRITKYDAITGEYVGVFATGIGQPTRMEIGPGNLLYVLQWAGNGRVLRYDLDGNFAGEFTTVGVSNSIGLDWDSEGNLYVASYDGAYVRRFDPNGNDLGFFISSNLQGPTNIWFRENGDLLVMDWNAGDIKRFNSNGVYQGVFIPGLSEPEGIEFLDNGDFLVANGGTSSVRRYTANGSFVGNFVPPGSGGLVKPNAIRFITASVVNGFEINAGLNDAWFNAQTPGQGLFVTVFPDLGAIFIAVFTYDTERPVPEVMANLGEPGHRWFTAFGDYEGDTAVLEAELTEGGVFNAAEPQPSQTPNYGTVTVVFHDCNSLTLSYDFPSLGLMGEIPMTRIALDNVPRCEALNAAQ